jgi:hypothetical protein
MLTNIVKISNNILFILHQGWWTPKTSAKFWYQLYLPAAPYFRLSPCYHCVVYRDTILSIRHIFAVTLCMQSKHQQLQVTCTQKDNFKKHNFVLSRQLFWTVEYRNSNLRSLSSRIQFILFLWDMMWCDWAIWTWCFWGNGVSSISCAWQCRHYGSLRRMEPPSYTTIKILQLRM